MNGLGIRPLGNNVFIPDVQGSVGPGTKTKVECSAIKGYSDITSANLLKFSSYSLTILEVLMGCELKFPHKMNVKGLNSLNALLYPSNKRLRATIVESSSNQTSDKTMKPI